MAAAFHPPEEIGREEIVRASERVLARRDIAFSETETVLRIDAAGMEWDIGVMLYEPDADADVPAGPDGRKVGVFRPMAGRATGARWSRSRGCSPASSDTGSPA